MKTDEFYYYNDILHAHKLSTNPTDSKFGYQNARLSECENRAIDI